MDTAYKEFLQHFLKGYNIDLDKLPNLQTKSGQSADSLDIRQHLKVISFLQKNEVYIYQDDYKSSKKYSAIKNKWQSFNDDIMPIENYIERFLVDKDRLLKLYGKESIYAMGNPRALNDRECQLAKVIIEKSESSLVNDDEEDNQSDSDDTITIKIKKIFPEFVDLLLREDKIDFDRGNLVTEGGLVRRLKRKIHFDITKFPPQKEYKAEICKIIYFFLKLEHTPIIPVLQGKQEENQKQYRDEPYFSLCSFLSEPSMQSIGYEHSRRRKTYNGKIMDYIKNELEKELNLKETPQMGVDDIKTALRRVANAWNEILVSARNVIDTHRDFNFDQMNSMLDDIVNKPRSITYEEITRCYGLKNDTIQSILKEADYTYDISPIELLYLIVAKFEYLCEITDKKWVNNIEIDTRYDVSPEFLERMKFCKNRIISDDIESYICENIDCIAEYVYLNSRITSAQKRRIKANIKNACKLLDYCLYAGRIIKSKNEISELLIISCLQTVLIDQKSDEEYIFYNYQHHFGETHKPKLRIPNENRKELGSHILEDQIPLDVIKLFWARSVEEHWYTNIGKHDLFCKLREFETKVYEVLSEKIYTCTDISYMENWSHEYCNRLKRMMDMPIDITNCKRDYYI